MRARGLPGQSAAWTQPGASGGGAQQCSLILRGIRAFIFRIMLPRCALTVISLIPSSLPTCLFGKPATTNAITSRSRALRHEYRAFKAMDLCGAVK